MPTCDLPHDIETPVRLKDAPVGVTPNYHGRGCFGCQSPEGLQVKVEFHEGLTATGRFFADPKFEGGPMVLHGGMLSLAFDETMGTSTRLVTPTAVTGTLEVSYYRPALVNQEIRIEACVEGTLRRKTYVSATAYDCHGETLATARAVFISVDPQKHFIHAINQGYTHS